jgi:hypothetical protein
VAALFYQRKRHDKQRGGPRSSAPNAGPTLALPPLIEGGMLEKL